MYNASELCHCNHPSLKNVNLQLIISPLPFSSLGVCEPRKYRSRCDSEYLFHHWPSSNQMKTMDLESFFQEFRKKVSGFTMNVYAYSKKSHRSFDSASSELNHSVWCHFFFFITEIIISDQATWLHQCADREPVSSSKCAKYKLFHI